MTSTSRFVFEFFRLIFAIALLISGLLHAIDTTSFARSVVNYKIIPVGWTNYVATVLPITHLVVGMQLILRTWLHSAFIVSGMLFTLYGMAGAMAIYANLDIDCGCLGPYSPKVSVAHVFGTLVASAICLTLSRSRYLKECVVHGSY